MKYLLFIPFAILLGLAAGSWAPREELIQLRKEVKQLQNEAKSSNRGGKLSALGNIIKIPEKKSERRPESKQVQNDIEGNKDNIAITNTPAMDQASTNTTLLKKRRKRRRLMPDPKSKDFDKDFEEAKELWQTRVEIARAQWLEKLNLGSDDEQLFDLAIAEMNEEIYQTMEVVADGLKSESEMTSEAGLRIVNQVTETLVETYDGLREIVPDEKHRELEEMEISDFIDPASFDPLVDVRDKL